MSLTGGERGGPTKVGVPIADLLAGIHGAYGVLAALFERAATGSGRVVRTSLLASVVGVHAFQGTRWTVAGEVRRSAVPATLDLPVRAVSLLRLRCAACRRQRPALELLRRRVRAGPSGVGDEPARVAQRDEVIGGGQRSLREVVRAGGPWSARPGWRASGPGAHARPGLELGTDRSQGLCLEVEHPALGRITLPGNPLRFDDNDIPAGAGSTRRRPRLASIMRASWPGWMRLNLKTPIRRSVRALCKTGSHRPGRLADRAGLYELRRPESR